MATTVVHFKQQPYDVYIGRPGPWGNPFEIGVDGTRSEVITKFEAWFVSQPELIKKARAELKDRVLGCWCKPDACHGDVIVRIIDSPFEFYA